jgi:hypothetical protein
MSEWLRSPGLQRQHAVVASRFVGPQWVAGFMLYFERSGHCTRCEARFDTGAAAYMVREKLIVAVCKKCLMDEERKERKLLLLAYPDQTRRRHIETTCGGCGQRIMTVAKLRKGQRWPVRACSDRCAQRMRRRPTARKRWLVERTCRCGELFMPKRSDAIYCSPACKQSAYRRCRVRNAGPDIAGDRANAK